MSLNIEVDSTFYKSDAIENGRSAKAFFEKLSRRIFNQSYKYWKASCEYADKPELPILYDERNIYSLVASAINSITPLHLSEWSFNPKDEESLTASKRIDFWCMNSEGKNGIPINYYIELKKGWYSLGKNSQKDFHCNVKGGIEKLIFQTKEMKDLSPNWEKFDDVYMGIAIIHGYFRDDKLYSKDDVRDNIVNVLDKRLNAQLITSTWGLPENMDIHWDDDKCDFVTIAGIILTKKYNAKRR